MKPAVYTEFRILPFLHLLSQWFIALPHVYSTSFSTGWNQLRHTLRLFSPRTVIRWHNELVKRKWTYNHQSKGGRPRLSQDLQNLIISLAKENPRWGYGEIEGELLKLGVKVSQTTIRNVLNRHGIVPAPVRAGSIGWRQLMNL